MPVLFVQIRDSTCQHMFYVNAPAELHGCNAKSGVVEFRFLFDDRKRHRSGLARRLAMWDLLYVCMLCQQNPFFDLN